MTTSMCFQTQPNKPSRTMSPAQAGDPRIQKSQRLKEKIA